MKKDNNPIIQSWTCTLAFLRPRFQSMKHDKADIIHHYLPIIDPFPDNLNLKLNQP